MRRGKRTPTEYPDDGKGARFRAALGKLAVLLVVSMGLSGCADGDGGGGPVSTPGQADRISTATPAIEEARTPTVVAVASPTLPPPTATPTMEAPTATSEPTANATALPTDTPTPPPPEPTATTVPPTELPAPAPAPPSAELVTRVAPGQGEVALLFNADSFEGHIATILDTLRAHDTHLTFFLTGGYLERYPEQVVAIDAAGHEIASHGYDHVDFRQLSADQIVSQIDRWREKFLSLTGKTGPTYWQPPFGYSNSRIQEVARDHGYTTIYWTRDVLDAVGQPKSKEFVLERVLQTPGLELDGAIILMHVDKDGTIAALPEMLEELGRRGLRAVTVGELLRR